jgi:hypothetical protein
MICAKRVDSIDPKKRPVNCKYYISVSSTTDSAAHAVGFCSLNDEFLCIEDTSGQFPRLSFSTVSDFLDCKRKYFLKHVKGIKSLDTTTGDALKMGQLWDVCIQTIVGTIPKSKILDTITQYEIPEIAVAKVKAIYKAFIDLDIIINIFCQPQDRFELTLPYDQYNHRFSITGVFDRKYANYFVESKFSGSPDYYQNLFNIIPQVGTYFASDPAMEYCIMEVVRTPGIHSKESSPGEYQRKCYDDIMSRPGWYFPGWNKTTRTFGKKFHRSEFNLDEIIERYKSVYYEITDAANRNAFYKNYKACYRPFHCDLISVCLFDTFSETQFELKPKPDLSGIKPQETINNPQPDLKGEKE